MKPSDELVTIPQTTLSIRPLVMMGVAVFLIIMGAVELVATLNEPVQLSSVSAPPAEGASIFEQFFRHFFLPLADWLTRHSLLNGGVIAGFGVRLYLPARSQTARFFALRLYWLGVLIALSGYLMDMAYQIGVFAGKLIG